MAARQEYSLQGWQRNKVYPDFIAYHETAVAQGRVDLKDGLNKEMTLTMLMEGNWREDYNKVKGKKVAAA